ncbi:hypothetical protein FIBSPDRAFT_856538 [Athelia psychrophila]|uniref:Uncharacterized protein n=1 Tax=Athelia psychrophila TaxID=1759441 RepID=A0A166N902_9AGAM|nr:hypothetical protein FIBSPDRAFT_856538 [Fibularhizoctonia sp. CBS 109695]
MAQRRTRKRWWRCPVIQTLANWATNRLTALLAPFTLALTWNPRAVAACSLAFHSVALDSLPYGNPTGSINLQASSFNRQQHRFKLALTEHRKRQPRSPTLLRSACWRQSEMFGEFRK